MKTTMDNSELENKVFIETLQISKNIAEKVNSILDFEILLNTILDLGIELTGAEKGFLMLKEKNSEDFSIRASINIENDESTLNNLTNIFLEKVLPYLKDYNTIILDSTSVKSKDNIKSILATKLKFRDSIIGYICLLNKYPLKLGFTENTGQNFNEHDNHLLEITAIHAAIAINNVRLYEKVEYETNIRNNLSRYLPKNTVLKLMNKEVNLSMAGELQDCSILFSDICGFTALSEKLQPQQVVSFLNEYLTIMTKVIFLYNGSIDKFIGDGIMAVFGAPVSTPNHAMEATLAALEMQKQIPQLKEKFKQEFGMDNFNIRIGINTGQVVYGNVGSPQRFDFTVIGDSVNVAARMESNAPKGGILVSFSTYQNIKSYVNTKALGAIMVKGKRDPVKIYEVLDKINAPNSLNLKVSISEKTKNIFQKINIPVKSFVVINKDGDITNGLIRVIELKSVSIGVVGNYTLSQKLTLSFKLTENFSFKNVKGIVKNLKKTEQEGINNKAHLLIDVEFIDLAKNELMELARFIRERQLKSEKPNRNKS